MCYHIDKFCLTKQKIDAILILMSVTEHETKNDKAIENLANDSHLETPFVNATKIARRYGVCRRTIHSMMQRRVLPYHKIGRCVRFKVSDCDLALEQFKRDSIVMKGGSR